MSDFSGHNPGPPKRQPLRRGLTLAQLKRIKNWHASARYQHPIESAVWEAVMTVWVIACIGWLPATIFEQPWAYLLCLIGVLTPRLYVHLRQYAHNTGKLRCEWLSVLA